MKTQEHYPAMEKLQSRKTEDYSTTVASLAVKLSFGVQYAVLRYMSFVVMCSCTPTSDVSKGLQYTLTMLYQRRTDACLGLQLYSQISHATLNHTMNISDSRAGVRYAECPHKTCMCVRNLTYKCLIGKTLRCIFGVVTYQSYLTSSINTENRHLRVQSCRSICAASVYDLQFSGYELSRHKMS